MTGYPVTDPSCIILSLHVSCVSATRGGTHTPHSLECASVPFLLRTERTGFGPPTTTDGVYQVTSISTVRAQDDADCLPDYAQIQPD